MNRIIRSKTVFLLVSTIVLCLFSYHVFAYAPMDRAGECPKCGKPMYIETVIRDATCTQDGLAKAMCLDCGVENYEIILPAYGHDYDEHVEEATCTQDGMIFYKCKRCGDEYEEVIPAPGHDYVAKVTKQATCEEKGVRTYTCSRCNDSYKKDIEALGHDYEYEEKEATCTEAGYKKGVCRRCGKEVNETYPAIGHDLGTFITVKEATCTKDGEKEAVCKTCGETVKEKIAKKGHKYPDEWTIKKKPGFFTEGLESKTCTVCGEKTEQAIPKKDQTILYVSAGVLAGISGIAYYMISRSKKAAAEAAKKVLEENDKSGLPSFEDKTILVSSRDEQLIGILKARPYLEVVTCDYEELEEAAEENGPDLVLIDAISDEALEDIKKKKKNGLADYNIGLVTIDEMLKHHKRKLDRMVKDEKIVNYVLYESDAYVIMTKLVLPILKPDLKSDESLGNIGMIADALGIPGVSTVIDLYVNGRDIKATLESGELGVSETATVIADIASILGMDEVASVAGLIDDIDSIKAAVNKEAGAHEGKDGISAAKDIGDVVSDIAKK